MLPHKVMIEQIQAEQRAAWAEAGIPAGSPTVSARLGATASRRWDSAHQSTSNHQRETERARQIGRRLVAEKPDIARQSLKNTASSVLTAGYQTLRDGAQFIGKTLRSANDIVKQVDVFPNFPAVQCAEATSQAGRNQTDLLADAATVADFRAMAESLGFSVRIRMKSTKAKSETGQTYYETSPAFDEATATLNGKLIMLALHNDGGFDPNALLLAEQIARENDGVMSTAYAGLGNQNGALCANVVPAENCIPNANYCEANGLYNDILDSDYRFKRFIVDLSPGEQRGMVYKLNEEYGADYVQVGDSGSWGELWMRPGKNQDEIPELWCNRIDGISQTRPAVPAPAKAPGCAQDGRNFALTAGGVLLGAMATIWGVHFCIMRCHNNKAEIKAMLEKIKRLAVRPAPSSPADDAGNDTQHELQAVRTDPQRTEPQRAAPQRTASSKPDEKSSSSEYLGDGKSRGSE
jgi:hypothetical protein